MRVTLDFFLSASTAGYHPGYWVIADPLPPECEIADVSLCLERNQVILDLVSPAFEEVPDGEEPPEITPTFQTPAFPPLGKRLERNLLES